jgi:hypothetical protein
VILFPKEHPYGRVEVSCKYLGEFFPDVGDTIEVLRHFDGPATLAVVTSVKGGITAQEIEPDSVTEPSPEPPPDIAERVFRAFVRPERAERYVALLKKGRPHRRLNLGHFTDLDGRWMRFLSQDEDNPAALYRLLRELGAPARCYVIPGDGEYHQLSAVLNAVHAHGAGVMVSCIPEHLAYYDGEDWRVILDRP